jgi:hypothetical protein
MRLIKLLPALAATAALLALASAGASARPAGHRQAGNTSANKGGNCHLSIEAPALITAGEPVTVFGNLTCATTSSTGVPVTVYTRPARAGARRFGAATFTGSTTTTTGGAYASTPPAPTVTTLVYAIAAGVRSPSKLVKVAPQVSMEGPAGTQLFTGGGKRTRALNQVKFTGKVNPFEPGELVALQRESSTANEEWHRIDLGAVNGKGEYTITHTFAAPGDANLRVVAHPGRFNTPGASAPLSYVISQRQNPLLTINASADPISYGQSVTISGVVAGAAAKQPLTLFARNNGGPLTPIATGETESGGAYKFTQAPLLNTAYRVSSSTAKSAVLFEGVKYVLTAAPTTTSVKAGQPLTVTGKVTPGHIGQVVHLLRQNASKIGFHVVDEGVVTGVSGNEGTFTITHAFFGPGAAVLRVGIPGNAELQGVGSALFNVEVTPAPAGTLRPEVAPKLPGVGQL